MVSPLLDITRRQSSLTQEIRRIFFVKPAITFFLGLWIGSLRCLLQEQSRFYSYDGFDTDNLSSPQPPSRTTTKEKEAFTTNFTFPSRQTRLKYYMGDWFNRTLHPANVPCRKIATVNRIKSDVPVLWGMRQMKREIDLNIKKNWLIGSYLTDAFATASGRAHDDGGKDADSNDEDRWFVLQIGDSSSQNANLPAVAKTRFSRFAVSKETGKPPFRSIIWPLEMGRHYNPLKEYAELEEGGNVTAWEDKISTLIWRGGVTGVAGRTHNTRKELFPTHVHRGWRVRLVNDYFHANISDVDVAFKEGSTGRYPNEAKMTRGSHVSMEDQLKFKYMLSIEGNDVATGLKWQLASNSVVFMARPTAVSYLMEDLLVPFVHYVPLRDDYSDLMDMVLWARENDEKCRWISERATLFMEDLYLSEEGRREHSEIKKELGEIYHRQFGEAVKSCEHKR